jgi:hypothetical protein
VLSILVGVLRLELSFFDCFDRDARVTRVTMPTARYLASRNILWKLLRIKIENYSHQHDNGNASNQTSMGINLFNTNLPDEI